MREFVFTVTYAAGVDDLMDVFIHNPDLSARTASCHVTTNTMWRVDEVSGPPAALREYDEALAALSRCSSLRGMGGCEVDWRHEVLEKRPTERVVYSQQSEGEGCRSIPYLVARYLGDGLLMRAEQSGHDYTWRIITDDDAAMSDIYEELRRNLRPGLELSFERVDPEPGWSPYRPEGTALSAEQREALELAVAYGYYEQPRRHSLQEIADAEGIPTSTLQYRITAAESYLVKTFVGEGDDGTERAVSKPA